MNEWCYTSLIRTSQAVDEPRQRWRRHTTGCTAVESDKMTRCSSDINKDWRCVRVRVCVYLSSKKHVVDQLHVGLHFSSLNIVQAVAQRVTLITYRGEKVPWSAVNHNHWPYRHITSEFNILLLMTNVRVTHLCFGELHYRPEFWHHLVPDVDEGNLTCRETTTTEVN